MKNIIFSTIFIILVTFAFSSFSFAETVDELKEQINNTNSEIEKINKEIEILSGQIAKTSEEKNTLANAIKDLTLKRDKLVKERQQTEKKIKATGLVIKTLDNDISERNKSLNRSKESLSALLKNLNQRDEQTFLQRLLSEDNLSDFSREYNNIIELNKNIKNYINDISEEKEKLTFSKNTKEDEQKVLNELKDTLTAKELEIISNKKEKDALLTATKNKESEYQKMLAEQIKRKVAFEKEIEDYEAQLKSLINPKFLPEKGSEVLSWPLNSVLITSIFGSRWGSFHYGVDFRAAVGTPVKATASGEVIGFGNTDTTCQGASFGKWIFIKYNNGLSSTYGHMSVISVKEGQKIKVGDIIGLSGGKKGVFGSGSSTGPHLHISVYASDGVEVASFESKSCAGKILTQPRITRADAHLNPLFYLPKTTASMYK